MRLLVGIAAFACILPLVAQDESVIKVDVNLVNLLFTVKNKGGGLVANLEKDAFQVYENGQKQEIKNFVRETNLPLTIGLLVDVSGSQENLMGIERSAAGQFFEKVLGKKDIAFLITFGAEAELLQDSTNSARLLRKGLDQMRLSVPLSAIHPGPIPQSGPVKGTIMYDAVYLAAGEKLKGEVGRKAIVLITDGGDNGSRYRISEAIEAAQKADTIIYSIYYADPQFQSMFGGGEGNLKKMSEETGGRVFHVDRRHSLDECFRELQDEMRSQYSLSYTPTNPARDGTFRKVEIKLAQKDMKVQARKGYYAMPDDGR
ncbi:MAG: VWA domain-containing protein [Bryobacteraceae bacterium]